VSCGILYHCNADEAKSVGMLIIETMNGHSVENYVFKKKNQAVLMTSKCKSEKKNSQTSKVDHVLLFLRICKLKIFQKRHCSNTN
jgi:hypothetical protein